MNTEELLYNQFTGQYVKLDNEHFIQQNSAIAFIELVLKNNVKILGIDGFDIYEDTIRPNLKILSDFSNDSTKQSIEKSKKFISENKSLVSHFSFVLDIE